ncbi:MAG: hypothetical protein ACI33M_11745 [Lysinibacillus sp.]
MSLNDVSMMQNVKKQVRWKLSSYSSIFMTIIAVQIIASLLFLNGTGQMSSGNAELRVEISSYSLDSMLMFSMITVFIISAMLASKHIMEENFSIVTTRLTASLSTIIAQLIICVVTTCTALSSFYISTLVMRLNNSENTFLVQTAVEMKTLFLFFSLLVVLSAAGFFVGSFLQMNRWIMAIIGVVVVIALFIYLVPSYEMNSSQDGEAIATNTTVWLTSLKCLGISAVIYAITIYIRNEQEVSRR